MVLKEIFAGLMYLLSRLYNFFALLYVMMLVSTLLTLPLYLLSLLFGFDPSISDIESLIHNFLSTKAVNWIQNTIGLILGIALLWVWYSVINPLSLRHVKAFNILYFIISLSMLLIPVLADGFKETNEFSFLEFLGTMVQTAIMLGAFHFAMYRSIRFYKGV